MIIVIGTVLGSLFWISNPLMNTGRILALGVASKITRAIGFTLQKNGYTYIQGNQDPVKFNQSLKITSWNLCGLSGGMSLDHGGVSHWRYRIDSIAKKILQANPDILILQEIYDTSLSEELTQKLKKNYAHIFTHLGPCVWGVSSGCMIFSKYNVKQFSYTPFTTNDWTNNRGFAKLQLTESPIEIISTHLTYGLSKIDQEIRKHQLDQIIHSVSKKNLTILAGDLNLQRDSEEGAYLSHYFRPTYVEERPTCTNQLTAQWDPKVKEIPEETIDYISVFKESPPSSIESNCHLIEAFDEKTFNTKSALSDHHGLCTTFKVCL